MCARSTREAGRPNSKGAAACSHAYQAFLRRLTPVFFLSFPAAFGHACMHTQFASIQIVNTLYPRFNSVVQILFLTLLFPSRKGTFAYADWLDKRKTLCCRAPTMLNFAQFQRVKVGGKPEKTTSENRPRPSDATKKKETLEATSMTQALSDFSASFESLRT